MDSPATKVYAPGEVIFREGERGNLMYVLLEGAVDLKVKVEHGEAVIKTVSTPNDFFGEMTLLDDRPRSATAIAERRTKVLLVDGPSFESMILQNGKFALKIIKVLTERIRQANDQVSDLIETMPKDRIARGMVDFALRMGERIHDGSYKVSIEAMKAWINSHLGASLDEVDGAIHRFLKGEAISYAATSAKTKEHVLLPEAFIKANDRRSGLPAAGS
jgi:CRP/FNR family transcriptional regulator/CRP/FNR family cyclic AMP-dependent transcriptional regulator